MRRTVVTVILAALLAVLGAVIALRWQPVTEVASGQEPTSNAEDPDAGEQTADASAPAAEAGPGDAAQEPAGPPPLDRPLRVVGERLSLLAPGILANGGERTGSAGAFERARLEVSFAEASRLRDMEAALAKGGAEEDGADIAIVPLPEMVAAYERLRALSPTAFFVAGWSHGRDGIYERTEGAPRREITILGQGDTAADFVSVFYLLKAGHDADQIRLTDTSNPPPHFAAVDHLASSAERRQEDRRPKVTTADATELVPYVAIAPEGFAHEHGDVLMLFVRAFIDGVEILRRDVPAGARTVAQVDGAPEAVTLVRELGRIDFAGLIENVRLFGLSGRDAVTLQRLFDESWRVWRVTGQLSTPTPDVAPLYDGVVSGVVRRDGFPDSPRDNPDPDFDTDVLLQMSADAADDDAVGNIGLLAGVFRRSAIRVHARGRNGSQNLIDRVVERYGLPPERFQVLRGGRGAVQVEVLATP